MSHRPVLLALTLLLATLPAGPTPAHEAPAADDAGADTTVTARLTTKRGNQVTVTIQGMSPEQIAQHDPMLHEYLRLRDKAARDLKTLQRTYGSNHPNIQDKKSEIEQFDAEIRQFHATWVLHDPQLRAVMDLLKGQDGKLELLPPPATKPDQPNDAK